MTTWRAPVKRAIAVAMMPIGPAPVISTSSPTTLKASAVWVALPNGSRMAAMSSGIESVSLKGVAAGIARHWAKAPGRWTRAGTAVAEVTAGDVPLARTAIALLQALHFRAELDDAAAILMTHGHRHRNGFLRPGVPVVDVHVGAADRGLGDLDQHVIGADLGLGDVLEPDTGRRPLLDQCFHDSLLSGGCRRGASAEHAELAAHAGEGV